MSFGLPPVKPKPELPVNSDEHLDSIYGVPNVMTHGLAASKVTPNLPHPVMRSELLFAKNRQALNMAMLRNTQGLHAPLKIQMEMKAASKVGRLPFLQSSNIMQEVLTGQDIEIGTQDVFNLPEFQEIRGQPHAIVERSLRVL